MQKLWQFQSLDSFFSAQAVVPLGTTVVPLRRYFRYGLPLLLPSGKSFCLLGPPCCSLCGSTALISGSTACAVVPLSCAVVPLARELSRQVLAGSEYCRDRSFSGQFSCHPSGSTARYHGSTAYAVLPLWSTVATSAWGIFFCFLW